MNCKQALVWTNKWLVLGNSKEMLYWKPITGKEIQDEAPCQIPVRARLLCGAPDNKIVAARTTGILFFTDQDLDAGKQAEFPWQIRRLKAGFCAEGSDITSSQKLSNSTRSYLEKNGASDTASHTMMPSPSLSFFNFSSSSSSAASPRQHTTAPPEPPLHLPSSDLLSIFSSQQPKQPLLARISHEDSDLSLRAGGGGSSPNTPTNNT